ncbi:UNVERIFIED_ORG: glycosyltransferase involved in cell wall biosynthesis [Arthrobacter sp. UYEF2]
MLSRADRILVLSSRAERLYRQAGLSLNTVQIIENFVNSSGFTPDSPLGKSWVYIGRLTEEKGIMRLLEHWPPDRSLVVYGDGPLRSSVMKSTCENVTYGGQVAREDIPQILAASSGLVFSSLWAEGAVPLTYIESLAAGRPVVAISGNAAADDILVSETGAVFDDWDQLPMALTRVDADAKNFSRRARERYDAGYGAGNWVERISEIYRDVIRERGCSDSLPIDAT